MFCDDGKVYGDYRETGKPIGEMTTREKLEFIKNSVTDLIDQTIESGMEPDFGKMMILIRELNPLDGPFCANEHGAPQQWIMTVGLRFELKKDQEEENHD